MRLLLLLIIVPIIEVYLFIQANKVIGTWPIIAIMIATAVAGSYLLRSQGVAALAKLQGSLSTGESPVKHIAHGALILVAGVVLLTPGFFTDTIGLLLLVPPVRNAIIKWGSKAVMNNANIHVVSGGQPPQPPHDDNTIDADFTVIDEDAEPGESGWTKH